MLQPRRCKYMGGLLASYLLLLVLVHSVLGNEKEAYRDSDYERSHLEEVEINLDRIKRDNSGITTILLVNNDDDKSGRSARPSGVLTSTARTFVHDGTTTEFGTQIVGTTLNHGQYYAQLLQTSSRIYFGDQEKIALKPKSDERVFYKSRFIGVPQNLDNYINPSLLYDIRPSEAVFIYPTKTIVTSNVNKADGITESIEQNVSSSLKLKENELLLAQTGNVRQFPPRVNDNKEKELLENLIRLEKIDLYNKRNVDGIKPSKVLPNLLPTVTIRHDFAPSGFSVTPDDIKEPTAAKSEKFKLRSGKSLIGKPAEKKYDTVTYLGFADFITTVGNTVIIFMPNTRAGDQTVKQTSVAQETVSPKPDREVMTTVKTFMSHSPGMVTKTIPGHSLSMQTTLPTSVADRKSKGMGEDMELKSSVLAKEQILFENPVFSSISESYDPFIEPSESVSYSSISRSSQTATEPLATFATTVTKTFSNGGSDKPLGLLKSIGGTKAFNGTTTHFTSLIYGTYVHGSYAQILKTSSSVFYLIQSSGDISATVVLNQFSTESQELPPTTTTTTTDSSDDEELLETSEGDNDEDDDKTTNAEFTTSESLVEKGKLKQEKETTEKIEAKNLQNHEVQKSSEVLQTSTTDELITRLVPSTVYKTFTYLTTFFIPADETTTTSIRSREVVTSDVNIVTKVIDPNLVSKDVFSTISLNPSKTNAIIRESLDDNIDPEFRVPSLRVLAPEEIVVIEDTEDAEESEFNSTKKPESTNVTLKESEAETTVISTESASTPESLPTTKDATAPPPTTLEESDNFITTTEELNKVQEQLKDIETSTTSKPDSDDEEIEVVFKTLYTTYTYLTTFFHESTISISSSEVVVTNVITSTLDNSIEPTPRNLMEATVSLNDKTALTRIPEEELKETADNVAPTSVIIGGSETKFFDDDDDDDVELSPSLELPEQTVTETPAIQISGLKTLFTTYTYFTTLFDNGSTEVKSRTEVVTNVVGPSSVSVLPSSILHNEALLKSKFEMLLREQQSQRAAASKTSAPSLSSASKSSIKSSSSFSVIQPNSTNYAFQSGATLPSSSSFPSKSNSEYQFARSSSFQKSSIRPSSSSRGKYGTITRKFKIPITPSFVPDLVSSEREEDNSVTRSVIKGEKRDRTIIRKRIRTKSRLLPKTAKADENFGITTIRLDPSAIEDDGTLLQTMVTDIKSSSSGGGRQIRIAPPVPVAQSDFIYDDQISSESNTEEIEPSPTLVLQTSYTTFTYFTTVYKGSSSSDVISRLETVTNIVTETVKPELLATQTLSPEDATLPITYFTTFTYWTTLYKDGNTVITSREETVSNVVTPSVEPTATELNERPRTMTQFVPGRETTERSHDESADIPGITSLVFVPEFVPAATPESITESPLPETPSPINTKPIENLTEDVISKEGVAEKFEPTTYYTTYTYFTTSYIGESTVLKSRLETVTNVISATPTISDIIENDLQTGRAINAGPSNKVSVRDEGKENIENTVNALQTGLLSTVVSSAINDGKTTLYSTDIFGTFIDGLYAKVLESTTKVISEVDVAATSSSEIQKTGIVSINEGKIVDADGISTTFFTTKAIGTSIEQLYAQVVESTSSVLVDNDKKSALASLHVDNQSDDLLRTGLVRLIEGSIIKDGTTTLYESRVIGTVIDGRYAQIIESSSTYKIEPSIAPSITITTQVTPTSSVDLTSPSPSAIEGSIAEDVKSQEEEEESDEEEEGYDDKDKGRVKSRLTFQSRKRTFTPVIRPFASRNRPTFLPKKKTVGTTAAQTITRANFTPTVTATPATKTEGVLGSSRNRFGNNRKSSFQNSSQDVKPTASLSSKKFGRNRTSFSSPTISSPYSPSRGRSSGRVSPTPTQNLSSTRGRGNFRGSSLRGGFNFESGAIRPTLSPVRPRIRPTLSGLPGRSASVSTEPPHDKSNDLTTVVTEEDESGFTADEENVAVTVPATTTTEDPNLIRRNNNPLLRFRRPLVPKASTTTTTPKPVSTQAPRRGLLNSRNRVTSGQTLTTAPRNANNRAQNTFPARAGIQNRPRPVNNLFPPRGLFKKPTAQEVEKEKEDEEEEIFDEEGDDIENEDNNYEESSAKEIEAEAESKKTEKIGKSKALNPVSIRPFNFQRRSKRQVAEYGTRNRQYSETAAFTPRYRRPKAKLVQAQEKFDYYEDEYIPSEPPKTSRNNGRTYSPRTRTNSQSNNPSAQSKIRPTTASSQNFQRAPFTIREKDTNSNPRMTNFRRGQTPSSRRKSSFKATEPSVNRKTTRTRTQAQNQALNDLTRNSQRRSYSNNRRISPSRSRSRFGDIEDSLTLPQPFFDGTITVTHKIPSEATIPVVNGKVTEYRNVITAKPSIEVLGPHQYTVSTTNGGTVLFLNREITETLNNGVTEVTRFLVHETPTTSITFTPTTIRGRKTSFSHIIPSTVYDVENIVTTLQPQLAANAPLANILLSQLLLGNLNIPPNQPLGVPPTPTAVTPTTEFKTRTTTYVTSVTEHISTVLPITFRGKEILTTIVDNTINVITATEFITDTIVITPTVNQNQQINSLLLPALLQAQLLNPNQQITPTQLPNPALTQLPFGPALGLDQLKLEALQHQDFKSEDLADDKSKLSKDNDIRSDRESEENVEEEREEIKTHRSKGRKKGEKKRFEPEPAKEVITLYVSGRRPGEFSTILSTVISGETSAVVRKRETPLDDIERLLVEATEVKQVRVLASKEITLDNNVPPNTSGHPEHYVTSGMPDVNIPAAEKIVTESGRSLGMSHVELRYNLATKVMRNGVEVIVATDRNLRPIEPEYLRRLSSTVTRPITLAPHTLTNLMSMVLPIDHTDDDQKHLMSILQPSFTTRTYYTTYNYPATVSKDNMTSVTYLKTVITNVQTEETKSPVDIQPTATQSITLRESMSLSTEVFPTAYTYWNTFLDGDQPIVMSSTQILSNTLVGTFDTSNELEPSEVFPSTNTYLKTIGFTKTITDGTDFQVISTSDLVTQVVVTEKLNRKATNLPMTTDVTKTYFVTYTYFSTYINGDQTKIKSDVSVSSDVTIEKFYIKPKKTEIKTMEQTREAEVPTKFSTEGYPFSIMATKTHATTFTFFTTLLPGLNRGKEGTKINSRTKLVGNTVTETISAQNFPSDNLLRFNSSLNRITSSLATTALPKGGEKIKMTAHKNEALSSSYLKYELKPTKIVPNEEAATKDHHVEKSTQELLKVKPTFSKSNLLSKTKNALPQKSKIKSSKTIIKEATAEALIAIREETSTLPVTSTVTFTPVSSSATTEKNNSTLYSLTLSSVPARIPEEATVSFGEYIVKDQSGRPSEDSETDSSKKKPTVKQPNAQVNVTNLLNLNSLGINGMKVLGPVFDAMAELIQKNLNKNGDFISRRNDTVTAVKEPEQSLKKPVSNNINPLLNIVNKFTPSTVKGASEPKVKITTPRAPVYIPVGSFAMDSEFGESQNNKVTANRPENWHEKWTDTHAKNFEKTRPHDPPITILEGGIPISPGQVITTNSDVIIGRPGETGPRPPTFAVKNNIPIDMKPPPLPPHSQFSGEDEDVFVGQHSTNQGVDLSISLEEHMNLPRPLLIPPKKRPPQPHKNLRPLLNDRLKASSLHHKNPHSGKNTHSDYDSGAADLNPPPVPPPPVRSHDVHQPITVNHEQNVESSFYKSPNHFLSGPAGLRPNQKVENYKNPAEINPDLLLFPTHSGHIHQEIVPSVFSEPTPNVNEISPNGIILIPTVAQVPLNFIATENSNIVDRSTGHQLLVNIQPSQVANIVIPHGSSTALILSDGKQHSLKGEVIDDPSPHPEPETVGFVGAEPVLKIENEDIAPSFHNDVLPAETGGKVQQSPQNNGLHFLNRPHLTTELIKIRPKPDAIKEQRPYLSHSKVEKHFQQPIDFALNGNHRQAEHNHKTEQDINLNHSSFLFEEQNNLKSPNGVYSNPHLQALHFTSDSKKETQVNQNYRKEESNINNIGGNFLSHKKERPNINNAAANLFSHIKEVPNPDKVHVIQTQHKLHNYLINEEGLHGDQNKLIQHPTLVRGGSGIYVDISPPGHLPPRPNINYQTHSPENHQPSLKEHLLNHQFGLVHDVPLNAQVQLGSGQKNENPLKEILINSNTNKHDHIYDSKEKPPEIKFSENKNHVKRPLPELLENLSPPPLSKENSYRIHRPHPFIAAPSGTAVQRYPSHPHPTVPKPADFMVPPPQVSHRPAQKLDPDHHPRPIIPIGARGPEQNYPSPRPEDILIVPHKNRPGTGVSNLVNNMNHNIKHVVNIPSDLDMSDASDPIKTEYGEEIQESVSRPLFPGQLPAELQIWNSSNSGKIHNHKNTDDFTDFHEKVNENSKSKGNSSSSHGPESKLESTKAGSSVATTIHGSSHHQHKKPDSQFSTSKIPGQTPGLSSNLPPFFAFIKKPSGFIASSETEISTTDYKETSIFSNHKDLSSSENHKPQSFEPPKSVSGVKPPSKGGGIRIHAIGPSALPSGFVKNKNAVDDKRPPTTSGDSASNESVQESSTPFTFNSNKNKPKPKPKPNSNKESMIFTSVNSETPTNEISSNFNVNEKTITPTTENKETKDKTFGAIKQPSETTKYAATGQNKLSVIHEPPFGHHKGETTSSFSSQKFNGHSVSGQTRKPTEVQEAPSGPIQFDSNKISTSYPISGVFKGGPHKPERYPATDVALSQNTDKNKRPSGFLSSKKEEDKLSDNFALGNAKLPSVANVKKSPPKQTGSHSNGPIKISSGFDYKNESNYSFAAISNHNYGNETLQFYQPKPALTLNEERDVSYNKPDSNTDKWFSSNFGGGSVNTDPNMKPTKKLPQATRNVSSLPNKGLLPDSDVLITLLPPPRAGDVRPNPEDVMGLSPPPLERPRRPVRPKPPFKLEIPATPKPTVPPISVENDFPPVRSPDFNRKPIKPQDIFPPRLPDNFIHHIHEYPTRNHLPPRPATSLPIDTPGEISTEKSIYSDANNGRDTFYAGSEINGHSKPISDDEPNLSLMRPPPPPPPLSSSNNLKSAAHLKPSTFYLQPSEMKTTSRVREETISSKQMTVSSENISPTSTLSFAMETTFHTKVRTSVTPTAEKTQKDWNYAGVITGSETVFDSEKFSTYLTPAINDYTTKRNIITTLVSTGSTTIFGNLYTAETKQTSENKKPTATIKNKENLIIDETTERTTFATPTKSAMHTTTLTVTTTMTTVVHSSGQKPLTKTIVLTKTLISTVFNKITETKTLVKPTTATIIQTHTIATTKTALVVPTALYPTQTKYPVGGTLKPEIFVADPHAKDTMTISVSSSMNKNKPGEDKRKFMGVNKDPSIYSNDDNGLDVISHEDSDVNDSRVFMGGVFDVSDDRDTKEKNKEVVCTPGCKAKRNELCQRIENVMKCVCRPGFARMFPDRPCRPTYTFNVHLMLESFGSEEITQDISPIESASPKMAKLASATKEGLDRMIMQSDLRDIYYGIVVNAFQGKEKKTMVDFYVQLSENTNEAKLMEILKKTLQSSNYSLGGTELFAARESGSLYAEDFNECLNSKFHDCSENARCFNLKGTYTCSCKEGFTDLSENSQFPGRVCSDTIGCEYCGYHGACYTKGEGQITCECFQWYSGDRCHINLKVLLIALVTIGAVLLALLLVCAVLTCLNRSRGSAASRTKGSSAGYLRYRGPSSHSLDRRAMIADSSSESSVDNLPYVCAPALSSSETTSAKKKPVLRHAKGPAPRPLIPPGMEQRNRSVTVMIPRAKYRPMPPLSPHLTMSTFSPDKHLSKTAAQITTEQKLINYLDGNSREDRTLVSSIQNSRLVKEQQKNSEFKTPTQKANSSPKSEQKKESKIFEYEYKISNMLFSEETNSTDKRSFKSLDDRFRRHSDSTHLNSDTSNRNQFRKFSAGALVSAGYEVSAKVGLHHLEEDTTEDDQSAIINTHTMKSNRSQFTTLNRTGDHKTMSEARSYEETTVQPSTRSLKTHYSGSSPSSRVNNDEGHTMIERDLGSTFIMPESQLFKPEADRGSDISNFDSL